MSDRLSFTEENDETVDEYEEEIDSENDDTYEEDDVLGEITSEVTSVFQANNQNDGKKSDFKKYGFYVLVIIGIIWFISAKSGPSDSEIRSITEEFVLEDLYYPEEATFGKMEIEELSENRWEVTGPIEGYNYFGVRDKGYFTAIIRYSKKSDYFYLDYLDYD